MERSRGSLLGGKVAYEQPVRGYRTGIEPVLLAAAVPARAGQRVLEAGTGAGAGLLCLHARVAGLSGVGVERDPAMAALARDNLAANGAAFSVLDGDVTALPALPPIDHAFANPPWHEPESTRSPDPRRDAATHRGAGGVGAWVVALAAVLGAGGTLTLALPAALLADGVASLHGAGLRRLVLWPLWPRAGEAAKIVLLQASRGAGPSRIGPGLVLHGAGSGYTERAEAILRDGAALSLAVERRKPAARATLGDGTEKPMSDDYEQPDGTAGRHQTARELAEQAMRAQARGDDDEADRLFAESARIDPEAASNALANAASDPADASTGADAEPQDDAEIEAMSRTVEPGADAPSRSGVSGRGSGADTEGT